MTSPETKRPWVARWTLLGPDGQRYSRAAELPDGTAALRFVALCHLITCCVMATANPLDTDIAPSHSAGSKVHETGD